jgi:large subunit ribosomal protein L10
MKTKQQKIEQVEGGQELLKGSQLLLFTDFTGTSVEDMKNLRKTLREMGAKFKVIKKRLLRIVFEKMGVDFNPEQFDSQLGTIFTQKDIYEIISPVYKFSHEKEKQGFKILGAYDLAEKKFIDADTVVKIGKLPSREVLLSQLVGVLSAPMRMLAYVLNEKGRKSNH